MRYFENCMGIQSATPNSRVRIAKNERLNLATICPVLFGCSSSLIVTFQAVVRLAGSQRLGVRPSRRVPSRGVAAARRHSRGRARRPRRRTSASPGASTRAFQFRLRSSAGAQRGGSAFPLRRAQRNRGILARIDSGGGRGGRIEGGAGGRRSRRERCTRDTCTPRPRMGCTTRIPPRCPCARRFRVTASAAGRRTTAA